MQIKGEAAYALLGCLVNALGAHHDAAYAMHTHAFLFERDKIPRGLLVGSERALGLEKRLVGFEALQVARLAGAAKFNFRVERERAQKRLGAVCVQTYAQASLRSP
jgi:hypothetical protein